MPPKPENRINRTFVSVVLLLILALGCRFPIGLSAQPTATLTISPTQGQGDFPLISVLNLPDGSNIISRDGSEIRIVKLAQPDGAAENQAAIGKGEALLVSQLPPGTWFTVLTPKGFIARVTSTLDAPGGIMLVHYDPSNGKITLDCIRGICQLGPDLDHLEVLLATTMGWLDHTGKYNGPSAFEMSAIEMVYGDHLNFIVTGGFAPSVSGTSVIAMTPAAVNETPTVTSSPTMSPDGTSTEFPGFAATATQTCKLFKQKYPATPCP